MAGKPASPFDAQALVADVVQGCSSDACRGAHVAMSFADAVALAGEPQVTHVRSELAYGSEKPSPIEEVWVERARDVGGVPFQERIHVIQVRRPQRDFLAMDWTFVAHGEIGKAMAQVAKAVKEELSARLKKGSSKSEFSFVRDGRKNTVLVSQGPTFLRLVLSDPEF
jgi:hypothetical protein